MRILCFFFCVAACVSEQTNDAAGCGKPLPSTVTAGGPSTTGSIESGGLDRDYLIHIPQTYQSDTPTPLIISYHGRAKDAAEQELLTQFSNPTFNPNAIVIYPNGVANSKGTRQWQGDPNAPASVDDIKFTSELIANLQSTYCVDLKRIYATGKSNGGGFCGLLACDPTTSSQIAAFAPASGAFYLGVLGAPTGQLPLCNPSRSSIPFLEFHGFKDKTIPYAGGSDSSNRGSTVAIPDYMDCWAQRNGIDPSSNVTETLCAGTAYPPVLKYSWGGGLVQHYNISNLQHDWPSEAPNDDDPSGKYETCVEATAIIMDFFNGHTL